MAYEGSSRPEETSQKQVTRTWNTIELSVKALASNSGLGKRGTLKKTYSSGEMAQMVEMRKRKWEKLLDTRPLSQSETELVLWIRKVLDVSDMTPPKPDAKVAAKSASATVAPPVVAKEVPPVVVATTKEPEKKEENKSEDKAEPKTEEKSESKPVATKDAPKKSTEEEGDKASGADSSEGDDEKSTGSDDEEDAMAEDEKEDGNISDASASSNGSSVDLRAHKRAKKE